MAQFKRIFHQDLTKRRIIHHCEDVVFTGDNLSDKIGVYLYDNGEPYAGGGTVSGTVINSRGQTVPITTGEISGNLITVTLEEAALAVPGIIGVYVKLTSGQQIATVLGAMFTAMPTETNQAIDPGTIILSVTQLITDIQTAVDSIPPEYTELLASVAPTFSASTAYTAGSYVWQGGSLYRFTADHAAGSWTGTDTVQVSLADDLVKQVNDLENALRERTDNLFPLEPLAAYGWTFHGNEVYGKISLLNGVKYLDDFAFAENTAYALSFYAKTAGETTDSNNGLRIRFYYTDGTYNGVSVRNNVLDYQYVAIISDATKTVDYIQIYYSNQGGNTWYLRDVMLVEGAIPEIYSKYETSIDTTARNNVDAITLGVKSASPSAINQYVWEDMQTSAVSPGWVLDGFGTSMRDANGNIYKYEVTPGDLLWINADNYASGTFQFQNNASVVSTGGSNSYLIGEPVRGGFNDLIVVPDGATHLLVSAAVDNPGTIVKKKQFEGFENAVLPGYWSKYIAEKAIEISRDTSIASGDAAASATPSADGIRFMFVTDTHLRGADGQLHNSGWSPLLMRYLKEHCNIGLAFFGGDSITGSYASQNDAIKDLVLFRDTFSPVWDWMYSIYGNHEYGNNSSSLEPLSPVILYNLLIGDKERQYNAVNRNYGSYSFDVTAQKIRFICMSCNYVNNYQQQYTFLCDLLLSTPSGWTIVILSHFSLQRSDDVVSIHGKLISNEKSIVPTVEAYMTRSSNFFGYDFSNADATVACILGGHTHWDGVVKTDSGVPVIATTCDKWYQTDDYLYTHTKGTTTENAFDVVTVSTAKKMIYLNRVGCGESREVSYAVT